MILDMETLNYFLSGVCAVCEVFLVFCFVDKYTGGNFVNSNKIYASICSVLMGIFIPAWDRNRYILISWLVLLFQSGITYLVLMRRDRRSGLLKLGIILSFNTYIGLLQLLIGIFIYTAFPEISIESVYHEFHYYRNICYWGALAVMTAIYGWSVAFERRGRILEPNKWIFLFHGIANLMFIFFTQSRILVLKKYRGMETLVLLLLFICASALVIAESLKSASSKARIELLEYRDLIMEENYKEIESIYKNFAYTQHDFKNHLLILSGYCEKGESEKALQYIEKIRKPLEKIRRYVTFQDDILSIILNYKLESAVSKGILIETDIDDIGDIAVEEHDLCSIVSNLLDNAIEACEDPLCPEKEIQVKIKNVADIVIIKISNTYAPGKKAKRSEKDGLRLRGFGKQAVTDKVKKYGGKVEFITGEKYYHAVVTICRD